MTRITLQQATEWAEQALARAGAHPEMARATAQGLVRAEAQGLASHGLSRLPQYTTHLRNGRALGSAVPQVIKRKGAALVVDAGCGLAFGACGLAVHEGMAVSHHCGVVVDHLRPAAQAGFMALGLANSPAAMPAAGGLHPIFGTNPVAAVFPRRDADPLMIDLSLSEVARGKLMVAAKEGRSIPLGWALDAQGQPTTDPKAGMAGSMLPIGAASSSKGAMLALVVELLVTAVIGAQFGFEASSFFVDEGNQPRIGQAFVLIDPNALAGSDAYLSRIEVLLAEMLQDPDVRLPGARRLSLERQAQDHGVEVPDALVEQIRRLAQG